MTAVPFAEVQGALAFDLGPTPARVPERAPALVVPIDQRVRSEAERWARHIVQAALEVVGGVRPSSQLVRWLSPQVYEDLRRRTRLLALATSREADQPHPVRARLQTLHASYPAPGILEAAVHVRHGNRSRAVAARFEQRPERGWVCTALDFA